MKPSVLLLSFVLSGSSVGWGQEAPPGAAQDQKPPQASSADLKRGASPAGTLSADAANADLKLARAAIAEKRYEEAEDLMRKDVMLRPGMTQLWLELGNAQLGLKEYESAEISYKAALSGGEIVQKQAPAGGFYNEGKGTVAHVSSSASTPEPLKRDSAEMRGAALSGLGEVYIHLAKIPEAKEAFEKAAVAFPQQAALYFRNETILFMQTGNAAEQVNAANKAIAVDPARAALYFYKGQGLAAQATIDSKTNKLLLPSGCVDALLKYLDLEPAGQYSSDAKGILATAGVALKAPRN